MAKLHIVGKEIVMLDNPVRLHVTMLCYLGKYSKDPLAIASCFGYAVNPSKSSSVDMINGCT